MVPVLRQGGGNQSAHLEALVRVGLAASCLWPLPSVKRVFDRFAADGLHLSHGFGFTMPFNAVGQVGCHGIGIPAG